MKPQIHGVLTPWIPGFMASGRRLAGVRQAAGSRSIVTINIS
jgi:hypothetical protein